MLRGFFGAAVVAAAPAAAAAATATRAPPTATPAAALGSTVAVATTKMAAAEAGVEDFERTPSGRVRRRSAQVAVFHLQEIAEDELAKDWGTKRRIKDDLVPDSKRVRQPPLRRDQTGID